jgi:hypothetical protein
LKDGIGMIVQERFEGTAKQPGRTDYGVLKRDRGVV